MYQGFRKYSGSFTERRSRLREVVETLTKTFITGQIMPKIRFDPAIPEVSLVHMYVNATVSTCKTARDQVILESKISCFSTIRPAVYDPTWSYFEFNIGPGNISISDSLWVTGWTSLLSKL